MRKLDVKDRRLINMMVEDLANAQTNRGQEWDEDQYRNYKTNETLIRMLYFSGLPANKEVVFEFYKKLKDEAPTLSFQNFMKEFEAHSKIIIKKILAHFC